MGAQRPPARDAATGEARVRLVSDPAGTQRVAILISQEVYEALNDARIAASARDGRRRTLAEFIGALVEALAQDCPAAPRRLAARDDGSAA